MYALCIPLQEKYDELVRKAHQITKLTNEVGKFFFLQFRTLDSLSCISKLFIHLATALYQMLISVLYQMLISVLYHGHIFDGS